MRLQGKLGRGLRQGTAHSGLAKAADEGAVCLDRQEEEEGAAVSKFKQAECFDLRTTACSSAGLEDDKSSVYEKSFWSL